MHSSFLRFLTMKFFILVFSVLVHASTLDSVHAVEGMKRFHATLGPADRPALMIGRGNKDGITDVGMINPALMGMKWLFVDPDSFMPGQVLGKQDYNQSNAIKARWPVDLGVENFFDVVAIDNYVADYFGNMSSNFDSSGSAQVINPAWVRDVEKGLQEAYKVLRYGGVFVVGAQSYFDHVYGREVNWGDDYKQKMSNLREVYARILGVSVDQVTAREYSPGDKGTILPKANNADNNIGPYWFEIRKELPDLDKLEGEQAGLDWAVAHKLNGGVEFEHVKLEDLQWRAADGRNRLAQAFEEVLAFKLDRFNELKSQANHTPNKDTQWALDDFLNGLVSFVKNKYLAFMKETKNHLAVIAKHTPNEHTQWALDDYKNKIIAFKQKMLEMDIPLD